MELVGLSDQVKSRIKTYLSARSCPSTIGQVRKQTSVYTGEDILCGNKTWRTTENVASIM